MKKAIAIIASVAMIIASCSKIEPEEGVNVGNEKDGIILNLSVSAPGSDDDSKAYIKTGWADGDQLHIWFDTNTGEKPDMVIKYNGSSKSWEQDGSAEVSGNTPAASGYIKVLYNNILAVTAKDPYEFADNTLSGRIQTWTFLTEIQVVVRNLEAADAGKYALSCDKFTTYKGHVVGADAITAAPAGAAGSFVNGISNADGVAFVYASSTAYDTETNLKFILNDGTGDLPIITPTEPEYVEIAGLKWAKWNLGASKPEEYGYYFQWGDTGGSVYSTPLTYTAQKKTIAKKVTRIKGIIIDRGNFGTLQSAEWINTKTGPTKMDWEHAPFNNGSSTFNQEYFNTVKSSVCPNNILAPEYDAAHTYLGGKWRMPTSQDFTSLKNATEWTFDETDKGYYLTKKGETLSDDKSNALLFFPSTGNGSGNRLFSGDCVYWSSSLMPSLPNYAYYLKGASTEPIINILDRYNGYPIRPVSD